MRVYTARLGQYRAPDLLDVTRKSARGHALAFAPSWAILTPALDARRRAKELRALAGSLRGDPTAHAAWQEALVVERNAWARYVPAYLEEMRQSYRTQREAWDLLLARPLVTLGCYCTDPARCHRTLLGRDILTRLGADFRGVRAPQQGVLADRLMDAVDEERSLRGSGS